jgi:hypothetical protein
MALNYVAPAPLATAGAQKGSGSLFQGNALPNITTTSGTATSVPQWYMDAIQQIGTEAAKTAQGSQFVGPTGLQNQAYNAAANLNANSGLSDALGNLNQQNIANTLAPTAVAGIAGTGQFGSARGAGALGSVISNANIATQAQQAQAKQQDFLNSINQINEQNTLGKEKQQILQNQQLFPMQQLSNEAALLKGLTIPTSASTTYTGPVPGAYSASPLGQIAGLGTLTKGITDLIPGLKDVLAAGSLPAVGSSLWNYITGGGGSPNAPIEDRSTGPTDNSSVGTSSANLSGNQINPLVNQDFYNNIGTSNYSNPTYGNLGNYYPENASNMVGEDYTGP